MAATPVVYVEGPAIKGPESSPRLEPEAVGPGVDIGAGLVPLSFDVLGYSPGEAPYGNFVHTIDTLAKDEDPQYVAIGGVPERPIVAIKKAVELILPYKAVPVVSWETAPTRDHLKDTLRAYAAEGVEQIMVAPTKVELEGKANFDQGHRLIDLLDLARQTEAIKRVGVVVRPGQRSSEQEHSMPVDAESERLAAELKLADFAVTQFVMEIDPYVQLIKAMREREVHTPITPSLLLFTNPGDALHQAQKARVIPTSELLSSAAKHREVTDWEAREASMSYNIALGRNLLRYGAPGLHIYTRNNIRWLPQLTEALKTGL